MNKLKTVLIGLLSLILIITSIPMVSVAQQLEEQPVMNIT